jgi:hypothetical protein
LVTGEGLLDSALMGAAAGAAAFLGWAAGRELDPDRPWTAGVAAVAAGLLVISGRPSLAQTALLMVTARVVTRSTGLQPTVVDRAVVVAGAGYVASTVGGFPVAVVGAAMMAADGFLPGGTRAAAWTTAAAAAVAAVVGGLLGGTLAVDPSPIDGGDLPAVIVAGLAIVGLLRRPRVTVSADYTGEVLRVGRVWTSRLGVGVGAALAAVWAGGGGIVGMGAAWAALAAASLPDAPRPREG